MAANRYERGELFQQFTSKTAKMLMKLTVLETI